jgi:transposase
VVPASRPHQRRQFLALRLGNCDRDRGPCGRAVSAREPLRGLSRIGVDEISWSGRNFLTVVVDQDGGGVVWVGEGKNADVLERHRKAGHACWRAQQLKEDFRGLYQLTDPSDAKAYLDRWLALACRCRIPPILKAVKMVRESRTGILAAVELGLSNSRLEGTNGKIRVINHRGYGHHSAKALTAMIYLCCSGIEVDLPW